MKKFVSISVLFLIMIIFIGCSTTDDSNTDDETINDGYKEPSFKPEDSWVYLESTLPSFYGQDNNRPSERKWIASKISAGTIPQTSSIYDYLTFSFENTDKYTRFLTDKLNPDGKETIYFSISNFIKEPPLIGTFTNDVWVTYSVYKSNGDLADNVRSNAFEKPNVTITKWTYVRELTSRISIYKMSGTAKVLIMYWEPGTPSTSDIHYVLCTFNNVEVMFYK